MCAFVFLIVCFKGLDVSCGWLNFMMLCCCLVCGIGWVDVWFGGALGFVVWWVLVAVVWFVWNL